VALTLLFRMRTSRCHRNRSRAGCLSVDSRRCSRNGLRDAGVLGTSHVARNEVIRLTNDTRKTTHRSSPASRTAQVYASRMNRPHLQLSWRIAVSAVCGSINFPCLRQFLRSDAIRLTAVLTWCLVSIVFVGSVEFSTLDTSEQIPLAAGLGALGCLAYAVCSSYRPRFSLRTLFIVTTLIAVILGLAAWSLRG
jgi:hypothetical protein